MVFVRSAKFAFLVQTLLIAASQPGICASLPAPKEHDTASMANSGGAPALRHMVRRHALSIEKTVEIYAPSTTPAPRLTASALAKTGQALRLLASIPAKSLKLVRLLGVGILNTSIAIPETILEKASQLTLSDLHLGSGSPAATTPPPAPAVEPQAPEPVGDLLSELKALKMEKWALLKQMKKLTHPAHGHVVIHKNVVIGPQGASSGHLEITTPIPEPKPEPSVPDVVVHRDAPVSALTTPAPPQDIGPDPTDPSLPDVIVLTDAPISVVTDAVTTPADLENIKDELIENIKDKLSQNEMAAPLKPTSVEPSPPELHKAI